MTPLEVKLEEDVQRLRRLLRRALLYVNDPETKEKIELELIENLRANFKFWRNYK